METNQYEVRFYTEEECKRQFKHERPPNWCSSMDIYLGKTFKITNHEFEVLRKGNFSKNISSISTYWAFGFEHFATVTPLEPILE